MRALSWMSKHVRSRGDYVAAPLRCRLIVREADAGELDLGNGGADWDETAVLAAAAVAAPELASELTERLSAFERRGATLACATLCVGATHDEATLAGRERLARTLLAKLTADGGGELVLAAVGADPDLRDRVLSLVGRLLQTLDGQSVTLRAQFRRAAPDVPERSEVRLARPEPDSSNRPARATVAESCR